MGNELKNADKLKPMGGAMGSPAYDRSAPMGGLMPGPAGSGLRSGGLGSGNAGSGLRSGDAGSGLTSGSAGSGLRSGDAGSGLTSTPDGTITRTNTKYKERKAREAEERLPEAQKQVNNIEHRLDVVEKWQNTAQGQEGIEIKGNVFTGRKNPVPFVPPAQTFTTDVLVISPTDFIHYLEIEITNTAVPWPDGTACTVDIGDQDPKIGFVGYNVRNGSLYLRWLCIQNTGRALDGDITITAFLPN